MSNETSKCYVRRYAQGHLQKLQGEGLDVGGGADAINLPWADIRLWDKKNGDGDAQTLDTLKDNYFDFLYSSHTLEHMKNPVAALNRWIDVVKPEGYLYVAVPDYDLYEGGDGIKNGFHKCAFTMTRPSNGKVPLVNVFDLLLGTISNRVAVLYVGLCDENFDYSLGKEVDQTKKQAVCHIEFMLQKRTEDV